MVIFDFTNGEITVVTTVGEIISINTIAILILKLNNLMQTKKTALKKILNYCFFTFWSFQIGSEK